MLETLLFVLCVLQQYASSNECSKNAFNVTAGHGANFGVDAKSRSSDQHGVPRSYRYQSLKKLRRTSLVRLPSFWRV